MRVLVTGGGGFLGAWMVKRLLARGAEVRVLDVTPERRTVREIAGPAADRLEWVVGDVADAATVDAAVRGCSAVAHIAGVLTPVCRADPVRGAQINLMGTLYVFEAARRHGVRRIAYTSSAGVYAIDHGRHPDPSTHYGAFKLAGEGSARAYWEDARMPSLGLRPLVIYGPGREGGPSAGVSVACRAAVEGRPYTIPFSGRSGFVFVDDVAAALELGLTAIDEGAHVYAMKGEVTTVEQIIAAIRRLVPGAELSCEGKPIWLTTEFDDSALQRDHPELHRTGIDEGMARTVAHYRALAAA